MNKQNSVPTLISVSGDINSGKDTVGRIIQDLTTPERVPDENGLWSRGILMSPWQIRKFAEKLKKIASILTGVPVEKFEDQEFKTHYMGDEWIRIMADGELGQYTFREFLQLLGTEGIRDVIHPNTWVNALFADYKQETYSIPGMMTLLPLWRWPSWVITDTRFENEAKAIKDRGGVMIRIERYPKTVTRCHAADDCEEIPFDKNDPTHMQLWKGQRARIRATLHESETALDNYEFDYVIENDSDIPALVRKVEAILTDLKII